MRQITEITNEPKQKLFLITDEGEQVTLNLKYYDTQIGWFADIVYNDLTINGIRLCISLNILRNYKNIIPFGLAIGSSDGAEPYFINDFTDNRIQFYLLNSDDMQNVEDIISSV